MKKPSSILFETDRLLIREFKPSDLNAVQEYAGVEEVVKYQNWGPNNIEETKAFLIGSIALRDMHPRMIYELCIELKTAKKTIGGCGLFLEKEDLKAAKIGYIINPAFWSSGYATEATLGLIKYGKEQLGLHTLRATCDKRNIASQRVLEKSGFELEKLIEKDFMQKGVMRDTYLYKLTFIN